MQIVLNLNFRFFKFSARKYKFLGFFLNLKTKQELKIPWFLIKDCDPYFLRFQFNKNLGLCCVKIYLEK